MKKMLMLGICGVFGLSASGLDVAQAENASVSAVDQFLQDHTDTYDPALPGRGATGTLTCPVCETSDTAEPAPFQELETAILGGLDLHSRTNSPSPEFNETPGGTTSPSTPKEGQSAPAKAKDSDASDSCGCTPYFWKFDFRVNQVLTLTEGKWIGDVKLAGNPCGDKELVQFAGEAKDADFAGCYADLDKHIMDYWSQRNEGPKKETINVGLGKCEYTYKKRFVWFFLDGERCRMCGGGCLPLVL